MSSRENIQEPNGASELPGWSLKQIVHVDAEHGYHLMVWSMSSKWICEGYTDCINQAIFFLCGSVQVFLFHKCASNRPMHSEIEDAQPDAPL